MRKLLCLMVCGVLLGTTSNSQQLGAGQSRGDPAGQFVANEILIKFRPGVDEVTKNIVRFLGAAARTELVQVNGSGELELASTQFEVAAAIAQLRNHAAVLYVEPNWILTHHSTPDDPYYTNGSLWGMYGNLTNPANQWGSQAGQAWANGHTGSSTIHVGVIDEGIDINHADLRSNIWTNPFDPIDGIDNDGNGIGVAGMNWNVRIISGKFLGPSGGTTANAIKAIDYMTGLKIRHGLNIVATNNSWGGGGYSQSLHDAIIRGAKAGILFAAAAGNGFFGEALNNDTYRHYPSNYNTAVGTSTETGASYDAVIAVASITSTGAKSSFSNYGPTTVDLGAPGSGVYSTTPNGRYSSYSGTSMATSHVTGALALYKSLNPGASSAEIKQKILAETIPTASLNGITVTGARLNVGNFGPAGPPPTAPSGLAALAVSSSRIDLSWVDQSNDEGGFKIERCTGVNCANFMQIATVGTDVTVYSNTGLSASTIYRYRLRAYNTSGDSGYSNEAEAMTLAPPPPQPPAAPSGLGANAASSSQINLNWVDNAINETGFKIERCQGTGCSNFVQVATVGANATTYSNTGLMASTTYRYRVRAYNVDGDSGYSNEAEATTLAGATVPAAPSNLTAIAGPAAGQIRLNWQDNSANEAGFTIEACAGPSCTYFEQLAMVGANVNTYEDEQNGGTIYRYRVRAYNESGNSVYSNIASAQAP